MLSDSAFREGIVLFNGSNTDERSKAIYAAWAARHAGSDRVTGSRTADMRSALVDYFREEGRIMIATEAGAEGINLQFCALVVNYDLPWNPQRIEQRIGRCHRYGQKHDVVVVNFLNRKNEADQRVFQLLSEKFQLFDGVFGASDEVLGVIESGVDFERRIAAIYQRCRKHEEIKSAFDELQLELALEIGAAMASTRSKLFEHFDEEVRAKLRVRDQDSKEHLSRFERLLMQLTRYELRDFADFHGDDSFRLKSDPSSGAIPLGLYELPRRSGDAHLYRLGHPLAGVVLDRALHREMPVAEIEFDYGKRTGRQTPLEPLVGRSGWISLSRFTVESLDQVEDHLIWAATTDDGQTLEPEAASRMFALPGKLGGNAVGTAPAVLREQTENSRAAIKGRVSERNTRFYEAEAAKLDGWADDLKISLEREIKDYDRQIKDARRAASSALALEDKLAGQKQIKTFESARAQKRRSLFDAQDEIDHKREQLIADIEGKLTQNASTAEILTIRWKLV